MGVGRHLRRVFFTPVISMISSSDPFIFTSSKLPNTHVCHRTISSERKHKYCNVREYTATGTCCSRCATKTIKNRGIQQHCVSWLNADAAIVSTKYQTKLAHREYRTKHQAEEIRLVTKWKQKSGPFFWEWSDNSKSHPTNSCDSRSTRRQHYRKGHTTNFRCMR